MISFRKTLVLVALLVSLPLLSRGQEVSPVEYGLHGGVGVQLPTGSLKNHFKGSALFELGADVLIHRWALGLQATYAQPSFNNSNIFNRVDDDGKPLQGNSHADASRFTIGVNAGYVVLDNGGLRITPQVGVQYCRYGWDVDNLQWEKDDDGNDRFKVASVEGVNLNNVGWTACVNFDIKLHSKIIDAPLGGDS
ncbi:MAG: hypothetical protein IK092_03335, partial [Muribaculaceae bacterium]|nr:hypothetical protein [Muribaculaceae bacterium]